MSERGEVWLIAGAGALLAAAAWAWWSGGDADQGADADGDAADNEGDFMTQIKNAFWTPPAAAAPYLAAIAAAEQRHGLPENMLARLLYQESRYRPEVISGRVKSSAGALGIAQFMPATARELGVNPLDPFASIDAAGRYLAKLYRRFGDWAEALAAYNWGQGNVSRKGLDSAPTETRNYFSQILTDLGLLA